MVHTKIWNGELVREYLFMSEASMLISLKSVQQRLLKGAGVYHRLKMSWLYDAYWTIANKEIVRGKQAEARFYRELLRGFQPGNLIFDIGANVGFKTAAFLKLGAKVIAVEPDEYNQEILRRSFLEYRLAKKAVIIVGKAVSDKAGTEEIWIDAPGSAKNTLSAKWVGLLREDEQRFGARLNFSNKKTVETTTLEDLIAKFGLPFFIKIDVEGYEPEVLRGLRQPVPYVSFEVNLPEFMSEGEQCVELLADLSPNSKFNYAVNSERGLELKNWIRRTEFLETLNKCSAPSIEVFWTSQENI